MKKVLVAGATGYLGQFVVKALKAKGYWIRALGRSAAKLAPVEDYADELFIGEVTDPDSLTGLCDGIDIVFSSVGITRQKDGLTYNDVDYQANRNLLTIAEASGCFEVRVCACPECRETATRCDDSSQAGVCRRAQTVGVGYYGDLPDGILLGYGGVSKDGPLRACLPLW